MKHLAHVLITAIVFGCGTQEKKSERSSGPQSGSATAGPVGDDDPFPGEPLTTETPAPATRTESATVSEDTAKIALPKIEELGEEDKFVEFLSQPGSPGAPVLLGDGLKIGDCESTTSSPRIVHAVGMKDEETVLFEGKCNGKDFSGAAPLKKISAVTGMDGYRLAEDVANANAIGERAIADYEKDKATMAEADGDGDADTTCTARFGIYTASRDIMPLPLKNCAAPQAPVTEAARIALAERARARGQVIYNQMAANYQAAQNAIAALAAQQSSLDRLHNLLQYHYATQGRSHWAWVKDNYFGHDDKRDDMSRDAYARYSIQTQAIQDQINLYSQVPPPNVITARGNANKELLGGVCILPRGVFANGGRKNGRFYGLVLETLRASTVDIKIYMDDHPAMPQTDRWGGVYSTTDVTLQDTDVTRMPLADVLPARATFGNSVPIVTFKFQPLSSKGIAIGNYCSLQVGTY